MQETNLNLEASNSSLSEAYNGNYWVIVRIIIHRIIKAKSSEVEKLKMVERINEELNRSEGRSLPNPYNQAERIIDRIISKLMP